MINQAPEETHSEVFVPDIRKITIDKCPLCKCGHVDVDAMPYDLPHPAGTHWFTCPVANGPLAVILLPESTRPVDPEAVYHLLQCAKSPGWFICLCNMKHDGGWEMWWKLSTGWNHAHTIPCLEEAVRTYRNKHSPPTQVRQMPLATPPIGGTLLEEFQEHQS